MNHAIQLLMLYLCGINLIAFLAFGLDKAKAKLNSWRISEKTLLFLALIGGSVGAMLGMKVFHHKVNRGRKPMFVYGIPMMFVLHLAVLYLVFRYVIYNPIEFSMKGWTAVVCKETR